jgi:hypothetical protein
MANNFVAQSSYQSKVLCMDLIGERKIVSEQSISLKQLENKAWRTVFQDGLWDIYLGLLLMAMAVNAWFSDNGMSEGRAMPIYLVLVVVSLVMLWAGKRFITVPRMGRFKPGQKGKSRQRKARAVLAASVLVGVVVFFLTLAAFKSDRPFQLNVSILLPAVWVVNSLLVFGLAAYFLSFDRLYIILLMGGVVLVRFLREYPIPERGSLADAALDGDNWDTP